MAQTYRVTGMTCGGCARSVEAAIKMAAPGARVSVDLDAKAVTVEGVDEEMVEEAVEGAGFTFEGAA
jgi:copper chaperone